MSVDPSASNAPRVCLFEDNAVAGLEPLTLTRPAFDLLCGLTSLGEKQRQAFGAGSVGALVRPHLAEVVRRTHPEMAVNDEDWLRAGPLVLVNARWLPHGAIAEPHDPCVGLIGDEVAYAVLTPEQLCDCRWDDLDKAWRCGKRPSLAARRRGG